MTPTEVAAILRQFNEWRRDFDDKFEQPDVREISEAIDAAIEMIERLEAAENDVALKERVIDALGSELNAVAKERDALLDCLNEWKELAKSAEKKCDALTAKIAEMEKQEPEQVAEFCDAAIDAAMRLADAEQIILDEYVQREDVPV